MIFELGLPAPPEQILLHLNAFHGLAELERNLTLAEKLGIRYVLIISGDGSERLPRLSPADVGATGKTVGAVELTAYIHRSRPGKFTTGAAFNQYEPRPYELAKLDRKIAAGAEFIVTQPILTEDSFLDELRSRGLPIFIEAWMSRNVTLLSDCIGYDIPGEAFDPIMQLRKLEERHADCGIYLALMSFKTQAELLLGEENGKAEP
jgi:methylenetetrahydrofolate reductase (NADPH)